MITAVRPTGRAGSTGREPDRLAVQAGGNGESPGGRGVRVAPERPTRQAADRIRELNRACRHRHWSGQTLIARLAEAIPVSAKTVLRQSLPLRPRRNMRISRDCSGYSRSTQVRSESFRHPDIKTAKEHVLPPVLAGILIRGDRILGNR